MKDVNVTIQIKKEDFKDKLGLKDGSPGPKGDSYVLTEADKIEIASKIEPITVEKVVEKHTETIKEVTPMYSNELTSRTKKEVNNIFKNKIKDLSWSDLKDVEGLMGKIRGFISSKTYSLSELDDVNLTALTKDDKGKYILGGSSGSGSTWTPQGVTSSTVGGIASGTDLGTTPIDIGDTLVDMFYPATAGTITLGASATGILREKGNTSTLTSVTFTATTNDGTNPITIVKFYRGASLIYTVPTPNPTGGTETNPTPETITTNTSYTAKLGDGILGEVTSNTISYTFASAYYYGVGAQGLTPTQVSALTKVVINSTATLTYSFSPTSQVYYFAYPDSYPALTSILDKNGFETISDWNVSTGNSITNSYGNTDTYRIYEFKNLTTQVAFSITFKQ